MSRTAKAKKAARRARGEGTLGTKTINGQTYYTARVRVLLNGKRRRRDFYDKTLAGVRAKRDTFLRTLGEAPPPEKGDDGTSVSDYIKRFLDHAQANTRATTHRSYEQVTRLHIEPHIGAIRIAALTDADVKAMYKTLESNVSPSMLARGHTTLRVVLNMAVEERVIPASPLATIRRSAPRYRFAPVQPLAEAQFAALLKAARGHRLEALFVTALDTGMREGELFALRWRDVRLVVPYFVMSTRRTNLNGLSAVLMLGGVKSSNTQSRSLGFQLQWLM